MLTLFDCFPPAFVATSSPARRGHLRIMSEDETDAAGDCLAHSSPPSSVVAVQNALPGEVQEPIEDATIAKRRRHLSVGMLQEMEWVCALFAISS